MVAISVVFGALILSGVYAGKSHLGLFQPAEVAGANGPQEGDAGPKANRITGYGELNPNDPVVRFSDTRVGQMLIASARSDQCRRLLFDNRTGLYYDAPEIFCGQKPEEEAAPASHDRLTAMRKAFKK